MVVLSTSSASAHDFYFSFAEMEYNDFTQKLELTIVVTTHDFERCLESQGGSIDNIASLSETEIDEIETYINKHFVLSSSDSKVDFKFMGNQVSLEGTTNLYFESKEVELEKNFDVTFDALMETFEDQQNKLTFYYQGRTITSAFTPTEQTQTIQIEKNEE